jgi:Bacterial Ig domain
MIQAMQANQTHDQPLLIPVQAMDHLVLAPVDTTIELGFSQTYIAHRVAENGKDLGDVTAQTVFSVKEPNGSCAGASCTASESGDYTVIGVLAQDDRVSGQAMLRVIPRVAPQVDRLLLRPADRSIELGSSQTYIAHGVAENGKDLGDVTAQTVFTIIPSGGCKEATCTPTQLGEHTVTGQLTRGDRIVTGQATLWVIPRIDHLVLAPVDTTIELGSSQTYTAHGADKDGKDLGDVTAQTVFTIIPSGACQGPTCTPTEARDHTVTGALKDNPTIGGAARLRVTRRIDHLELQPASTLIELGESQTYTANAIAKDGTDLGDVTAQTVFTIIPSGGCKEATCTPTKVGDHTVTGTLTRDNIHGSAALQVLPRQPSISSVTPSSTLPGRSVEVRGNTGSCNRAGTLTFHGMTDVSMDVTADENGNFVARFTVPRGTFPRAYKLELTVDCNRQLQWVQSELTVINLAPVAVDDSATTTQDTPVAIAVAANDRNPDPDTGYQTVVVEHRSPPHGMIQVRSDRTIVYTPEMGFLGSDQFQYSLCDNIINAAGRADCATATVTVTVNPRTPTTTVPPTSGPPTSGPPTTTNPRCAPSAGEVHGFQVVPIKGAGGVKLRITAKGDRNLASCPLMILLGGFPLDPAVRVGSDGSISAQRSVPKDAKPGISTVGLAMTGGQILAETPFEITPIVPPWWTRGLLKLLIGAGAFGAGAVAQAANRRWRISRKERTTQDGQVPQDIRTDPHTGPAAVAVEPNGDSTQTFTVRLEPHHDPGIQTVQEVTG